MMVKEYFIQTYGPVRYTIRAGWLPRQHRTSTQIADG